MAPITRSSAVDRSRQMETLQPPGSFENHRDASWQFVPELKPPSERELSAEPASSYDEDAEMMSDEGDDEGYGKQLQLEGPEDHEDILHPLREAANRVGREVEKFAEVLDGYNPLRTGAPDEKLDMTLELIELYHGIAAETLDRLWEQHHAERRKKDGLRWRTKMRGFKITQDADEFEPEEDDAAEPATFPELHTTLEDLERWEQETQTWDLLRRLVRLRHDPSGPDTQNEEAVPLNSYSSPSDIWKGFFKTDDLARERNTVLQWLKDTAGESGEDIDVLVQDLQQNAERGDIIAHGWLHTKAAIKHTKRINDLSKPLDPASPDVRKTHMNSSKTEALVTQLDPDAPTRQSRKLQVQDQYFERAICLGCYEMLRRGKRPDEIREWCMERTETWRAVSMSGFPDPEDTEPGDPASWLLWRRMCHSLAHNGGGDEYERAVYGILSGDISSVEPVCRSWDDFVFAHYNALLRTQFDSYLQKIYPQISIPSNLSNFGAFDAVQFHGDPKTAGKRLIGTLENDPRTRTETLQPMKMLQGVLVADQFQDFIYQQGLALSKFANAESPSNLIPAEKNHPAELERYVTLDDHDSLRVLTHVLLVYMSLGVDLGGVWTQTAVENVIVSYISFLRLSGKEELIPLYCSQLTGPRRYAILSRNLIDITDHEQRVTQIRLMRELGLDVQEFVRMQSRYLFHDYPDTVDGYPAAGNFKLLEDIANPNRPGLKVKADFFGDDEGEIERVDMLLIRSLEWYLLVDGLWSETFVIGTMLYLRFFKHMHLSAARLLASRVCSSDIALNKTRTMLGESIDFNGLENEGDEDMTEVLDGSAERRRLLKKHLVAEAKNFREFEALVEVLDMIETASSLEKLLDETPDAKMEKDMKAQLGRTLMGTRGSVPSLLKGWLLTFPNEDAEAEFLLLREAYLPETILAYISTLEFAGGALTRDFLMECMDLAATIAEDDSDLLPLFEKTGKMPELAEAFAFASKALLLITSAKRGASSRSKKMKANGWTHDLWSVKSNT